MTTARVADCPRDPPRVRVLAFAGARDAIGAGELDLACADPATAGGVLAELCERFPKLSPYRGCVRVAVNGTYAKLEDPVQPGDEVALIPPVAGG